MRILHLYADPRLTHGAAVFEYRLAEKLKQDGIFFDYLVSKEILPEDEARYAANGSRVFNLGVDEKLNLIAHEIKANIAYYKFFKTHKYDIVYADTENALRAIHLLMARLAGVKVRVLHSHNTQLQTTSRVSRMIARFLRYFFRFSATHYFACSDPAAQWLFPPSVYRKKQYEIACNGVDLSRFCFDAQVRDAIRSRLGIENHFVLGCIGRFMPQKNHAFLIDVLAEMKKLDESACLMLIGEGPLKDQIVDRAREAGVQDSVLFMGSVDNVQEYLCAMDFFALASVFEGLGIVNIEAQATGLPCLMSDAVPADAKVCELACHMPLKDGAAAWAQRIMAMRAEWKDYDRTSTHEQIIRAGYSIENTVEQMRKFYLKYGGGAC